MPTYQEWLADQKQQQSAAQKQYTQAQANYAAKPQVGGGLVNPAMSGGLGSSYISAGSPNMAAYNAAEQARGNLAAFDPNSADNQAKGNKLQAYDLANTGINRITNDPTDQFIRQALQTAAGPDAGPYNATTRNAMFTGAMESSGNKQQIQSIMDSAAQRGMNASDPSVQAALRNAQGQQAQAGQRARLGIDTVANPANYAAQQSAVNRLGDYNTGKQNQTQSAEDRLREMLWNEGFNRQTAGPQVAGQGGSNSLQIGGPATQTNPGTTYSSGAPQGNQQPQAQAGSASGGQPTRYPTLYGSSTAPPIPGSTASGYNAGPYNHADITQNWTATGPAGTRTGQNPGWVKPGLPGSTGFAGGGSTPYKPLGPYGY